MFRASALSSTAYLLLGSADSLSFVTQVIDGNRTAIGLLEHSLSTLADNVDSFCAKV